MFVMAKQVSFLTGGGQFVTRVSKQLIFVESFVHEINMDWGDVALSDVSAKQIVAIFEF